MSKVMLTVIVALLQILFFVCLFDFFPGSEALLNESPLATTPLASASIEQLANHKVVSCSKVENLGSVRSSQQK